MKRGSANFAHSLSAVWQILAMVYREAFPCRARVERGVAGAGDRLARRGVFESSRLVGSSHRADFSATYLAGEEALRTD